mmetsp:Transcript_28667/g.46443  ORF Transcript_28667/g.46443 Transcript_28667/m.46443 type:complete len:417 (+) Transcript_28667:807-2057(+)
MVAILQSSSNDVYREVACTLAVTLVTLPSKAMPYVFHCLMDRMLTSPGYMYAQLAGDVFASLVRLSSSECHVDMVSALVDLIWAIDTSTTEAREAQEALIYTLAGCVGTSSNGSNGRASKINDLVFTFIPYLKDLARGHPERVYTYCALLLHLHWSPVWDSMPSSNKSTIVSDIQPLIVQSFKTAKPADDKMLGLLLRALHLLVQGAPSAFEGTVLSLVPQVILPILAQPKQYPNCIPHCLDLCNACLLQMDTRSLSQAIESLPNIASAQPALFPLFFEQLGSVSLTALSPSTLDSVKRAFKSLPALSSNPIVAELLRAAFVRFAQITDLSAWDLLPTKELSDHMITYIGEISDTQSNAVPSPLFSKDLMRDLTCARTRMPGVIVESSSALPGRGGASRLFEAYRSAKVAMLGAQL